MPCPLLIFSQSDYLIQMVAINSHTWWQTVQIQISDLDLHCLQNRVYLGSAGQGLINAYPLGMFSLRNKTNIHLGASLIESYANCMLEHDLIVPTFVFDDILISEWPALTFFFKEFSFQPKFLNDLKLLHFSRLNLNWNRQWHFKMFLLFTLQLIPDINIFGRNVLGSHCLPICKM